MSAEQVATEEVVESVPDPSQDGNANQPQEDTANLPQEGNADSPPPDAESVEPAANIEVPPQDSPVVDTPASAGEPIQEPPAIPSGEKIGSSANVAKTVEGPPSQVASSASVAQPDLPPQEAPTVGSNVNIVDAGGGAGSTIDLAQSPSADLTQSPSATQSLPKQQISGLTLDEPFDEPPDVAPVGSQFFAMVEEPGASVPDPFEGKQRRKSSAGASKSVRYSIAYDFLEPPGGEGSEFLKFTLLPQMDKPFMMPEQAISLSSYGDSVSETSSKREEPIDRNVYYRLHAVFSEKHRTEKMKNNFLQSRLASYYMRRKMLYVLREQTAHLTEMQTKYEKELDTLEDLLDNFDREKQDTLADLQYLTYRRDMKIEELQELFDKLIHDELEYGKSLTYDKTGKYNMDKIVERFTKRQKNEITLLSNLRLVQIKLRNKMSEKVRALEELDHLGPGFGIMDYVQLKTDNRDLQDKLEEKECELTKLRKLCQNTMQILAHNREKNAVIDLDMTKMQEELENVDTDYMDAREQVYYLRQERDEYRNGIKHLKTEFSMISNIKLLRDMEQAINELDTLKTKLDSVRTDFYMKSDQLAAVRKNMEWYQQRKNKDKVLTMESSSESTL